MLNKMKKYSFLLVFCLFSFNVFAQEVKNAVDADMEAASADMVDSYQVEGSLFEQITLMEQEKVLMQLEKERAQLDLELDRLAAEKIKLNIELDALSGQAQQQQQEFEATKAKLEAEIARLEREKQAAVNAEKVSQQKEEYYEEEANEEKQEVNFKDNYRLVNVIGIANQLQATIEDLNTGQTIKLNVGKSLEGYTVKSISIDEGVVFEKGTDIQILNVINSK